MTAALLLCAPFAARADSKPADEAVRTLIETPAFKTAATTLAEGHDKWVQDVITLTEIPAPPFKEQARARAFAEMLRQRGLASVEIDEEGNVLGLRSGTDASPVVVVSAHLDTVFPEGTNIKVRREGETLHAPGVGDDSGGLATILSLIDAMNAAAIRTKRSILFVGTVGEEGLGDLRGVRHLFTKGQYKGRIAAFFSIDGEGQKINTSGTGSKRYRIAFKGPGGHSYNAFGIVNPMRAAAQTIVDLYDVKVPADPKTTYSASVIEGGTSVNAIPDQVSLDVDMRSASASELDKLEKTFLGIVERSVTGENSSRSTAQGKIAVETKVIGDRPAGRTQPSAEIIQITSAAFRAAGIQARDVAGSTDSNVPMSLGIPAVTVPGNARGERAHALDEWISIERSANVRLKRILLSTILATAGTVP